MDTDKFGNGKRGYEYHFVNSPLDTRFVSTRVESLILVDVVVTHFVSLVLKL